MCLRRWGSSPVWSIQAERMVRRGRMRSQAIARSVPYRSVTCAVAASGSPQVSGEAELLAVLRRSPALGVSQGVLLERGRRPSHDAVGTHPSQHLDREAVEEVGHARGGVAGAEDDEDVAVAEVPAAHLDQVRDHTSELGGGDLGDVVLGPETDGVKKLAPGRPARFEGGDEGVRPAGDELVRGASAAAVDVAEQSVRAWSARRGAASC